MSLMGFVTGVASLFGGGGGGSKSTTTTTTRNEDIKRAATGRSQSKQYNDQVLSSISSMLQTALGSNGFDTAQDALTGRLSQVQQQAAQPGFDVDSFVNGIMQQANATAQMDMDSQINSNASAIGGTSGGNSMAALLENRIRNDTAANLAGIQAQARATGQQIQTQQQSALTDQIGNLSGGIAGQIMNLLQTTRGAEENVTEAQGLEEQIRAAATQKSKEKSGGNIFENIAKLFQSSSIAA
jgi:hypothetical protein